MHMIMVVIAGRSQLPGIVRIHLRIIVGVVVVMIVAVMPEMRCKARRMFQRIANAHGGHISGIQREHESENNQEIRAHDAVFQSVWRC